MNEALERFIDEFNRDAALNGKYRNKLGRIEMMFLEQVWGPSLHFNYSGLKAEHPFTDYKGGQRFADFVYVKNGIRLVMEIDGFTTHARDITPGEFNDHLMRQNDLILSGWLVLRFSAWQVENQPKLCERQIKQAIGQWWTQTHGGDHGSSIGHIWDTRKRLVIQMAMQRDGRIKPSELVSQFQISNRTAVNWLKRFEQDGILLPSPSPQRISIYCLPNYKA